MTTTILTVWDEGRQVAQVLPVLWVLPAIWAVGATSGFAVIDFAGGITTKVNTALAKRLRSGPFCTVLVGLTFLRPVVAVAAFAVLAGVRPGFDREDHVTPEFVISAILMIEMVVAVPTLLVMLGLAIAGRWRTAPVMLTFSAGLAFSLAAGLIVASMGGYDLSDLWGTGLQAAGPLPPMLLFIVMFALSLFSLGSRFASRSSSSLPRPARVLLALGLAVQMLSFSFWFVVEELKDHGDVLLEKLQSLLFSASILWLGLPYLVFLVIKRRHMLIGDAPARLAQRSRWPWLDRQDTMRPTWIISGVGCVVLVVTFILASLD
ncbi:hypothetical protein [Mariniluteicoccus flavus]